MNRLKFTSDWDKLREPGFTTIRSYRREKEEFYRVVKPRDLPDAVLLKDVQRGEGPDPWWLDKLLAMDRALLLEFENHTGLMERTVPVAER